MSYHSLRRLLLKNIFFTFKKAFIFNHASDGNPPCIGQLFINAMTEYTKIEKT